jgi:hypothetical protein
MERRFILIFIILQFLVLITVYQLFELHYVNIKSLLPGNNTIEKPVKEFGNVQQIEKSQKSSNTKQYQEDPILLRLQDYGWYWEERNVVDWPHGWFNETCPIPCYLGVDVPYDRAHAAVVIQNHGGMQYLKQLVTLAPPAMLRAGLNIESTGGEYWNIATMGKLFNITITTWNDGTD